MLHLSPSSPGPLSWPQVADTDTGTQLAAAWGIGLFPPWLWGPRIRILFVLDGDRINTGSEGSEFGLGLVLDTLTDRSLAWWVRFDVDVCSRTGSTGFRFDQPGFDIDAYDQVWFFGDFPGEALANDPTTPDHIIDLKEYSPLVGTELTILAEWMDRRGGVFATGDHSLLGASMCHRIPRVRTMRKWTHEQGVPSFELDDRHETLQRTLNGNELKWELDRYPQPISPVYQRSTATPALYAAFPHAVLCGRSGIIDRFPDHMHEGEVVDDGEVKLDEPLGIPGYERDEYPVVPQVVRSAIGPGGVVFGERPRPQVIVHGYTTHPEAPSKRFGVVGVYDGDRVGLGRVIVDSTWHHWLSFNLVHLRDESPVDYRGIQDYFRNVATWLCTPAQRFAMLIAATWGAILGSPPGLLSPRLGVWGVGDRAVDVIGRVAPQCLLPDLVASALATTSSSIFSSGHDGMVSRAIVGGIGLELLPLEQRIRRARALGSDDRFDVAEIHKSGIAGVTSGQRALDAALGERVATLVTLREAFIERPGEAQPNPASVRLESWERDVGR